MVFRLKNTMRDIVLEILKENIYGTDLMMERLLIISLQIPLEEQDPVNQVTQLRAIQKIHAMQ